MVIRTVLADDHTLFLDALYVMLQEEEGIDVIGKAENGVKLLEQLEVLENVDVVVMDVEMPELDGVETMKIIRKKYPHLNVLMVSMFGEKDYITNLMTLGAKGYILKNKSSEELVSALHTIANGGVHYPPEILKLIVENTNHASKKNGTHRPHIQIELTKREKQVLSLIGVPMSSKEIAEKLFIAPSTVETHVRNLLGKLDLPTRGHLIRYVVENDLVYKEPEE